MLCQILTQPTLVIVGTDDIWTPAANSLMIAENIPGAWLDVPVSC